MISMDNGPSLRRPMTTRSQSTILVLFFAAAMAIVALIPRPAGAETREEIALRIERISEQAHQLEQRINKLQGKQDAAQADLQRKAARRQQLENQLTAEKARSVRLKKRLAFARKTLAERIVTVYKEGEPHLTPGERLLMSELLDGLTIYPQVLENVRVTDKKAAQDDADVQAAVKAVTEALGDTGRILVRESGTEPLLRVMVEAETEEVCRKYVDQVVDVVKAKGHIAS